MWLILNALGLFWMTAARGSLLRAGPTGCEHVFARRPRRLWLGYRDSIEAVPASPTGDRNWREAIEHHEH